MSETTVISIGHGKRFAVGDIVVLTALVRDLARAYPGRYAIRVATDSPAVWMGNPYCQPAGAIRQHYHPRVTYYRADYGAGMARSAHETVHYVTWSRRDFQQQTGIAVPVLLPYPDIHLRPAEATPCDDLPPRYWVLAAGGKSDAPAKVYPAARWQVVVDGLAARGLPVVQVGKEGQVGSLQYFQPQLDGVVNRVNQTSFRDLVRLVAHAEGVLCGVSMPMHLAAALQKPCVVVAGGREAWYWEAYTRENIGLVCPDRLQVPHRYLHTCGLLDCQSRLGKPETAGCWRSQLRTPPAGKSDCLYPTLVEGQVVPKCLTLITPEHVLSAVESYYREGILEAA